MSISRYAVSVLSAAAVASPAIAELTWVGAAGGFGGDDVSFFQEANWQSSFTGVAPLEGEIDPGLTILDSIVATGVTFPNIAAGAIELGLSAEFIDGDLRCNGVRGFSGFETLTINGGVASTTFVLNLLVSVTNGAELTFRSGDNPINTSTVDIVEGTVILNNESLEDFLAEHATKFTVGGSPLALGEDPAVLEEGDNAVAVERLQGGTLISLEAIEPEPEDPYVWGWRQR